MACRSPLRRKAAWLGFVRDLVARGLSGFVLVTSDAHAGLVEAIAATLPGASRRAVQLTRAAACSPPSL